MGKHFYSLLAIVGLASGLLVAQSMPGQQPMPRQLPPPTMPQTQPPPTADQSQTPVVNTAAVQTDIQSALQKDPTLAGANIDVKVTDKNVELSGTVPTKEEKNTAAHIARQHSAGLDVKNHIKVSSTSTNPVENPK